MLIAVPVGNLSITSLLIEMNYCFSRAHPLYLFSNWKDICVVTDGEWQKKN